MSEITQEEAPSVAVALSVASEALSEIHQAAIAYERDIATYQMIVAALVHKLADDGLVLDPDDVFAIQGRGLKIDVGDGGFISVEVAPVEADVPRVDEEPDTPVLH